MSSIAAKEDARRTAVALLLFALTLLSTTFTGAMQHPAGAGRALDALLWGLWYALPLCLILACHEAGHYLAARHHGVPVSLPYFLPFPAGLGTLGAIIGLRREVRDRDALFDVAAAGPLAGLAVAVPVLAAGLWLSPVGPVRPGDLIEGQSLLYLGLKYLIKGRLLPGVMGGQLVDVQLHPLAMAGWAGLLVTMMNALPIGQLDGGHIAAAYFGAGHERRSRLLHRGLLGIWLLTSGFAAWQARRKGLAPALLEGGGAGLFWLVWAGALLLMRRASGGVWHPEVAPAPLSPGRRALCGVMLGLLCLLFMPYLMREVP